MRVLLRVSAVIIAAMALTTFLYGCKTKASEANANSTTAAKAESEAVAAKWPDKLIFGYLPNEESADDNMKKGSAMLMKAMTESIGIPVEIKICNDYNAVIEAMRNQKVHIAQFGPFSYIIANERSKAEAVCVTAKDKKSATYNSYLITHVDSGIKNIEDIRGKSMSFVDPASTSGNLVPRFTMVNKLGVKPEEIDTKLFSSVQFAGNHQNSFLAAANKSVDVAACDSNTYTKSIDKGLAKKEDIHIINISDPIPSSPVAVYSDLPADLKQKIIDFFHTYDDPEYFTLRKQEGKKFIPMEDSEYKSIRDIAKLMNLSPEELLK